MPSYKIIDRPSGNEIMQMFAIVKFYNGHLRKMTDNL